jgi:light-regulated signal transduction histidine kinase (bacteriophytochrome)
MDMMDPDKLNGIFQRLHSVKDFEGSGLALASIQPGSMQ